MKTKKKFNDKRIFPLNKEFVNKTVPKNTPGVYRLGERQNNSFYVCYIGRSNTDLFRRLMQHCKHSTYSYFDFTIYTTRKGAAMKECVEYHSFSGLKNKIHPSRHKFDCECQVCITDNEIQTELSQY